MRTPLAFTAALDAIAQFRATGQPMRQIASQLSKQRKLGQRDRQMFFDLVYAWVKQNEALQPTAQRDLAGTLPNLRDLDRRVLELLQEGTTSETKWPDWFQKRLMQSYPDDFEQLQLSLTQRAQPVLAFDKRFLSRDDLFAWLSEQGIKGQAAQGYVNAIEIESDRFSLSGAAPKISDNVWVMDTSSQIAASFVRAKPGDAVLDYCAGLGGKSRFLVQTDAAVVAMDIDAKRLKKASGRPGLKGLKTVVADGREPPFGAKKFDWILLDAPCSGSGTLRRAPDLLLRLKEEDVGHYASLQGALLQRALQLLQPNGILIYATCSLFFEENEAVVKACIEQGAAVPVALSSLVSDALRLSIAEGAYSMQLLPHRDRTDGFYIAALQRGASHG